MYISKLSIANFKKFKNVEFQFNEHFNLLIGSNNAGKSTMMEALRLWQLAFNKFLKIRTNNKSSSFRSDQYFSTTLDDIQFLRINNIRHLFYNKDATKKIIISVTLSDGESFVELPIKFTLSTQEMYLRFELCPSTEERKKTADKLMSLIGKTKGASLKSTILISYISPLFSLSMNEILYSSGYILHLIQQAKSNEVIRNILYKYLSQKESSSAKKRIQEIEQDLTYIIYGKRDEQRFIFESKFKPSEDKFIDLLCSDSLGKSSIEINQLGSGTLNLLNILAVLSYGEDEKFDLNVLLLDEPDSHLHADFQKRLYEVLQTKANDKNKQMFVITHNHELIEASNEVLYVESEKEINTLILRDDYYLIYKSLAPEYYCKMLEINETKKRLNYLNEKLSDFGKPLIITEGKTDWKHIKHALKVFQNNSEFENLQVNFLEYENEVQMGGAALKSMINHLKEIPHSNIVIGVFDSDDPQILKFVNEFSPKNNVFCFIINDYYNYNQNHDISIELLYKKSDITVFTVDGRRLYLNREFSQKPPYKLLSSGNIVCQDRNRVQAVRTEIIADQVYTIDNEESIALSKEKFADAIYHGDTMFDDVNCLLGFKHIFEKIEQITNEVNKNVQ